MSEQTLIRVGLVGVGSWATYGHIPALMLLPQCQIAAVCSRSIEKATRSRTSGRVQQPFERSHMRWSCTGSLTRSTNPLDPGKHFQ